MTHPTDDELERVATFCALAAKVMRETGTFETGQSILDEAAAMLRACKGKEKPMRCAECDCSSGGAECTWIKTPDPWHTIDSTSVAKGNEMTNLTTSEQVTRHAPDGDFSGGVWMTESPDGEYVRHSDYIALAVKLEAAEADRDAAIIAIGECMREIDDYIRQEYPGDHPVHDRYRQRDFSANPAREFLQARPASYVAARQKGGAI